MEITTLIDRAKTVRDRVGSGVAPVVAQRVAASANELSRAGDNLARVGLMNEAALALLSISYQRDIDWVNVDTLTWRFLIPLPWGRSGCVRWGLRYWEAEVMRKILIVRSEQKRINCLFDYNERARTWHLNLTVYPNYEAALAYWKKNEITLADFRKFSDIYRMGAIRRVEASKSKAR